MKRNSKNSKHMTWLVKQRSANQKATLNLLCLYDDYKTQFVKNYTKRIVAQHLTSAAFSLWRAVFLSNVENVEHLQVEDTYKFLENLVLHNSISYQNDQNASNFTFRYYVIVARDRLQCLQNEYNDIGFDLKIEDSTNLTAKQWWETNHADLVSAITVFDRYLKNQAQILGRRRRKSKLD